MSETKKRVLSDQQQAFLDALAGDAKGDFSLAKKMAGYAPTSNLKNIINELQDEILDLAKGMLVMAGPKAAHTYMDVLTDKAGMNVREKLNTASQIFDRIGLVKKDVVEVETKGASIVLLPAKQPVNMDDLY